MKLLYLYFILLISVLSICLAYPEGHGNTQGSSAVEISLSDVSSTNKDSFQTIDPTSLSDTLPMEMNPISGRRRKGSSSNRKVKGKRKPKRTPKRKSKRKPKRKPKRTTKRKPKRKEKWTHGKNCNGNICIQLLYKSKLEFVHTTYKF